MTQVGCLLPYLYEDPSCLTLHLLVQLELDLNHELAGKHLTFDVELVGLTPAERMARATFGMGKRSCRLVSVVVCLQIAQRVANRVAGHKWATQTLSPYTLIRRVLAFTF